MNYITFALVLVSVSLNALAQVALRKAMLVLKTTPLPSELVAMGLTVAGNIWLWAGMACYAASIGIWLAVLARVPVSMAYPMLSIGYVIAAVLGVTFLGETVNWYRGSGIALICVGVFLVARSA